jgi:hypothetical protein
VALSVPELVELRGETRGALNDTIVERFRREQEARTGRELIAELVARHEREALRSREIEEALRHKLAAIEASLRAAGWQGD